MTNSKPNQLTWKKLLPRCFGIVDLIFGLHPADDQREREMIRTARKEGASNEVMIAEARKFLETRGASKEHIEEQLKLIGRRLSKATTPGRR